MAPEKVGLIPAVIKFTQPSFARPIRIEAAAFLEYLCETTTTRQMPND